MEELIGKIIAFRNERNWKKFHNPKDLAISISIEASELLENFQWLSSEQALRNKKENIKEEIADVLIYAILFADAMDLDIEDIVRSKLKKNNEKYPVDKAFGSNKKYTEL